jgi:hypothetical protein
MSAEEAHAKSVLVEKVAFAVLPMLFACVVYLMTTLSTLSQEVTVLNSKVSLVVTSDNKQASNSAAELAREKLRQDLEREIQENRHMILENKREISVIEQHLKDKIK